MNRSKYNKSRQGYTLAELSLAIALMSLLLIIMTTLILGLIAIYRKGITIDAVNRVGRSIIEDFQNSISEAQQSQNPESICGGVYNTSSSAYSQCVNDKAKLFIYHAYESAHSGRNYPRYGVFCTGSYSYVWNTGYALDNGEYNSIHPIKFTASGVSKTDFRLLKILDRDRNVCKSTVEDSAYTSKAAGDINISAHLTDGKDVADIIADSDTQLAIYHLYLSTPATNSDSRNAFYSGSFVLGTQDGGIDIVNPQGGFCKPPGDSSDYENFDYCAINKFNFAVQGNGG